MQAMLATQKNQVRGAEWSSVTAVLSGWLIDEASAALQMVQNGEIREHTVIRLKEFMTNDLKGTPYVTHTHTIHESLAAGG